MGGRPFSFRRARLDDTINKPAVPEPHSPPLFRPEAMGEPEFGEALAFAVPQWRALAVLAAAALATVLAFGFIANFDRVARVRGLIVPAAGMARLAAPQPGAIRAIYVRQGQSVREGAPILTIASSEQLPSGAGASAEALRTFRQEQNIAAQRNEAEQQRYAAERSRLEEQSAELTTRAQSTRQQIALQHERIAKNEKRLRELVPLRAKGYVSEVTVLALEESVLTQRQQLAVLRQNEAEAGHELQRTRLQAAELAADGRRAELQAQAAHLALERGAAGAQVKAEVTLVAPLAGTISLLRASLGMAVRPSEELAAIVPDGGSLEALIFVPPSAAGSLREGQRVALRYDAFPYQRHGVGHGILLDIASSATAERTGQEPTYRVKVRLTDADRFDLRPDMTLAGIVTLERRSLLDWLFAPLREKWRESRRSGAR